MKILLHYLKPYRWLVSLALLLAAINQSFSMLDPYYFGKFFDKFLTHPFDIGHFDEHKNFVKDATRTTNQFVWGVLGYLGNFIGVVMVSRIAKAVQEYFTNVLVQTFGANVFTD